MKDWFSIPIIILYASIIYLIATLIYISILYRKKRVDVVISRYNEDVSWINTVPFTKLNCICYNKGKGFDTKPFCKIINLENVGRCDHTVLYHIINNYDNLADTTIFLPGSCMDDHKKEVTQKLVAYAMHVRNSTVLRGAITNDVKNDFYDFSLNEWVATNVANKNMNNEANLEPCSIRPFGKWYETEFQHLQQVQIKVMCYYGIFAVSKQHIRQHPVEFYQRLISYVDKHSNPEAGHYMERAWGAIFYPYQESCVISDADLL